MPDPIKFSPPKTLARFLKSDAYARVVQGPVGSGKTSACVFELLRRSISQAPYDGTRKTRWVVIRNTYRELEDTTRKTFEEWIPGSLGKWREKDFAFELAFPLADGTRVESEILFRALDSPEDVRKLLSLEITGAYLNELKEIPEYVITPLNGRIGRYPSMKEGGPSWRGWWADTNPWHVGHWGYLKFKSHRDKQGVEHAGPPPGHELYVQPSGLAANAENVDHLDPGYYDRLQQGADEAWIDCYVRGMNPAADTASVYGKVLGPYVIEDFQFEADGINATYDLGKADATAIWFWKINRRGGLDFIEYFEATGENLPYYFDYIKTRPFKVRRHWLPHDAAQDRLGTELTVEEQFRQQYPSAVQITPQVSIASGIAAARWVLEQPCRFGQNCRKGLELLRHYHFQFDHRTKTYRKDPLHDFSSHCFTADTRVLTPTGPTAISSLPPTGKVLTPNGWKTYCNPRITRQNANLVQITFRGGYQVKCTPDHLFMTDSGWKSAEQLQPGSLIRSVSMPTHKHLLETITGFGRASAILLEAESTVNAFIGSCGKRLSDLFRRIATSIIETRIPLTTRSRIWSAWTLPSIFGIRPSGSTRRAGRDSYPKLHWPLLPSGTEAMPVEHGTPNTANSLGSFTGQIARVNSVAKSLLASSGRILHSVFAGTTANPPKGGNSIPKSFSSIAKVERLAETADVWDITVPDGHWFCLANGAVVHNCADALRYTALVAKVTMGLDRGKVSPASPDLNQVHRPTLDELFEEADRARKQKHRI